MIATFVLDIFTNFVCNGRIEAFLVGHLLLHIRPRELITR
jgi:hypothetical protein